MSKKLNFYLQYDIVDELKLIVSYFFHIIIFQNAIKTTKYDFYIQFCVIFLYITFSIHTQFEVSTKNSKCCQNSLKWIKTKLYISQRYFLIDQQIAQYFAQYSEVLTTPIPFYANQIINPFLTSRVSANHDKRLVFQRIRNPYSP